jgi:hypothetical protein
VREIREIAVAALNQYDDFEFGDRKEETFTYMRDDTYLTINHVIGIATHYNRVIVIINPDKVERSTYIFFPLPRCEFSTSLSVWDRDMNSYHVSLNDKFSINTTVSVNPFLQHANEVLNTELTGDSTVIEVMRIALRSSHTIVYTTQGIPCHYRCGIEVD